MKNKLLIAAFAVAVIASFSFITIKQQSINEIDNAAIKMRISEPMSGFVLEDENPF